MSEGLNQVMLVGNLGADPELTQTSGGPLLRMRLATTVVYYDKEKNKQEQTEWHNVKLWGRRAEGLSRILVKGSRIVVNGRLETSDYEKDGQKRYRTDVVATNVLLAGGPSGNGTYTNGMTRAPAPQHTVSAAELPF